MHKQMVVCTCLALSACAVERQARLYPSNEAAAKVGVLTGKFMASGTGSGTVEIAMPNGEVLRGEFSIVRGSPAASVLAGSPAMASAVGPSGLSMQCDFQNDNFSGHGFGNCIASTGLTYRLQY